MLRISVLILLASTSIASAQLFERRQPTTIFGPNPGQITTISPTPGGFFATDNRGGMAMGSGNVITITPAMPLSPSVQLPRTSLDNW